MQRGAAAVGATPNREVPPAARPRLVGVDATRGVALLGMMAVHALYAYDAQGQPTTSYSLAAGRSAAVFAVLAGVGIAFLTGRRRVRLGQPAREVAASLAARALVIGAVGLALGYTDVDIAAVILPYYSLLFLVAIPLVLLPTAGLVAFGTVMAVGSPFLSHVLRSSLPPADVINPSLIDVLIDPLGILTELLLTGEYPVLAWTVYVCFGIAVGRLRLSSPRTAAALVAAGTVAAVGAFALSAYLLGPLGGRTRLDAAGTGIADLPVGDILAFGADGVTPTTTLWWLAVRAPHTGTPLDLTHTTGPAVALLGALLLLGHVTVPLLRWIIAVVLTPLAAAGSMTLTLYTAHVVFMNSPLDVFDAVPGYVVQVVAALLFALAWRQAVGRGPLESVAHWASRRARRAAGGVRMGVVP
jgi:uncharacterized membrane protein YeiB